MRNVLASLRCNRAVVTVEAAIVFPLMLTLIVLFMLFMRMVIVEVVVQKAASQTAHQLSSVLYPFETVLLRSEEVLDQIDIQQMEWIPASIRELLDSLTASSELPKDQLERLLAAGLKPLVWSYIPEHLQGTLIHYDRLDVHRVQMPYLFDHDPFFDIELHYELPITLPFYHRVVTIAKLASERVWFGS